MGDTIALRSGFLPMKLRRRAAAALILILASAPQGARRAAAAPSPPPRLADHVIVVMLDGCRPDILRRANAPVLHALVGARGATWTINGKKTLNEAAYKTRYDATAEGSADLAAGYKQSLSRQLLTQTLEIVRDKRPALVVVNLGSVDYAGHSFGPEGSRYREAIEFLDGLVGDLLKALDEMGIRARTTV